MSQGVEVGLGSAARSTSSTGKRKSITIGPFSGGQYCSSYPLIIADGPSLYLFGLRTFLERSLIFRDFSGPAR